MKKILILIVAFAMGIDAVNAAVRDGNSASRTNGGTTTTVQKRVSTTERKKSTTAPRVTVLGNTRNTNTVKNSRTSTQRGTATRNIIQPTKNVTARAATPVSDATSAAETRTGGAYESCKTAFFSCMDQFCSLKNDDYRRCSCSDRVDSLGAARDVLIEAGEQLTIFTENLDTVGMTAAQACGT